MSPILASDMEYVECNQKNLTFYIDEILCFRSLLDKFSENVWKEVIGVFFVCVSITSTFLNVVVLSVICRYTDFHRMSYMILATLTVSDLLTGLIVAPLYALQFLNDYYLNVEIVNNIRRYCSAFFVMVSANVIGFISFDRYLHLLKLSNYKTSKSTVYTVLTLAWLLPGLTPLLRLYECTKILYSYMVSFQLLLILIMLIIIYSRVVVALNTYKKQSLSVKHAYAINQSRASRTVVILIVLYITMDIPICIHFFMQLSRKFRMETLSITYTLGTALCVSNSSTNPLVYCYRTPKLRYYVLKLVQELRDIRKKKNRIQPCQILEVKEASTVVGEYRMSPRGFNKIVSLQC